MGTPHRLKNLYHQVLPFVFAFVFAVLFILEIFSPGLHIYPPVGAYIAFLAFLAGLVTVWPPEHPRGRTAWVMVFLLIAALEICNLYRDRAEHDAIQARVRKEERDSFGAIAGRIEASIAKNDADFQATMKQSGNILETTTGGSSLCYIRFAFRGNAATVVVLQIGNFPLSDVTLTLLDNDNLDSNNLPRTLGLPPIEIGTLPVNGSRAITPFGVRWEMPSDKHEKRFLASFKARNGAWDQMVLLRADDKSGWHFATRIERNRGQSKLRDLQASNKVLYQVIDSGFPGSVTEAVWRSFSGRSVWCSDCR